mmetsp:Transcript_76665/g.215137  ORF Transcript_76665/g.215137 Transcript_76665/m.215137 type:complete len:210 (-) Transcript_76665:74-703(-)
MEAPLQQQDPLIEQVVIHSKFVVAYHLQQDGPTPGWRKANIEGPMYIVRRTGLPRYKLILKNNDLSADLVDALHPDWELDCQSTYIFYKVEDPTKRIRGLWFHDETERVRVEQQLEALLQGLRRPQPQPAEPQPPPALPPAQPVPTPAPVVTPAPAPAPAVAPALAVSPAGAAVTVTPQMVKAALHKMADDEDFLRTVMDKLQKAQASG